MSVKRFIGTIALIIGVAVVTLACVVAFRGSRITCQIVNGSGDIVTGLTVTVAGNRHVIGTVKSGESWRGSLTLRNPAGGVVVAFTLPNGTTKSEVVCGYIESKHFRGEVNVEIRTGGELRIVSNTIGISYFP